MVVEGMAGKQWLEYGDNLDQVEVDNAEIQICGTERLDVKLWFIWHKEVYEVTSFQPYPWICPLSTYPLPKDLQKLWRFICKKKKENFNILLYDLL